VPEDERIVVTPSALWLNTSRPGYRVVEGPPGSVGNRKRMLGPATVKMVEPLGPGFALTNAPAVRTLVVLPVVSFSSVNVLEPAANTARGPTWTGFP